MTGLVTSYDSNPSNLYFPIMNELVFEPSGLFVSKTDYDIGCFYCSVGKEIRYNTYRDKTQPACCVFDNPIQVAQTAIAQQLITVNNINYVSNYVSNIVQTNVTTQLTQVLGQDYSSNFQDIATRLNSLDLNYNTLMNKEASDISISQQNTWNNSQAIASLQATVNNLITIIKGLNIRNISQKDYTMGLI